MGGQSPHREKTHSFLFLAAFSVALACIVGRLAAYFAIGYASHLFTDYFNKKGEQLLWPLSGRYSCGLCSADGLVNKALFWIGVVVCCTMAAVSFENVLSAFRRL